MSASGSSPTIPAPAASGLDQTTAERPGLARTSRFPRPCDTFRQCLDARGLSGRWVADRFSRVFSRGYGETGIRRQLDGLHRVDLERLEIAMPDVAEMFLEARLSLLRAARMGRAPLTPDQIGRKMAACVGDFEARLDEALSDGELSDAERRDLAARLRLLAERASIASRDLAPTGS